MNYLRSALNHARTWYKRTFMARLIFAWLAIYGLRNAFFSETWPLIEPFPLCAFFRYHAQLIHWILRGSYLRHCDLETTSQPDTSRRHRLRATSDSTSEDARQVSPISESCVFSYFDIHNELFSPRVFRAKTQDRYWIWFWTSEKPSCWNFIYLEHSILVSKSKYDEYGEFGKGIKILIFTDLCCYKDFARFNENFSE